MVPILYELMLFLISNALYTSALIHHLHIRHICHLLTSVIPLQNHIPTSYVLGLRRQKIAVQQNQANVTSLA